MSATDLSMAMPTSVAFPKGRILCVDDEPNILRALGWLLQKEFEVVTAAGGREGLALVRQDDFDVVISDQRMPGMTGVEFLREVKALSPRSMRILLTGYSDLNAALRSVNESEIFRYVTKPWNVAELPRIVAQAAEIARNQPRETACPPEAGQAAPEAGERRILVLDDDVDSHHLVARCAGDLARVVPVTDIPDAIRHLQDASVGVLVAELRVGTMDMTRLLCLLKQRHPQMVSVVLTEQAGTDTVMKLVNQGQVFRFVSKPADPVHLREVLRSALTRSAELYRQPELGRRHVVDVLPEEEQISLKAQLEAASRLPGPASLRPPSLGGRVAGFLRRFLPDAGRHA